MSPSPSNDLSGTTSIVTGATSGLGRACAEQLAARGARLELVARNAAKAAETCDAITTATGNEAVDFVIADFASQTAIRDGAKQLLERCERIDLLLNNAGVTNLKRELTADGIEATFGVNHLGYFLLTNLLLPRIEASAPARIVSVASDAHKFSGPIEFDDLESEKNYSAMRVYGRSKGANILWNRELARRLEGSGVTANALHPGFVRSNLGANNGTFGRVVVKLAGVFAMSADKAARYVVDVCTDPDLADTNGGYFYKGRPNDAKAWARDDDAARRLWEISERMTGAST